MAPMPPMPPDDDHDAATAGWLLVADHTVLDIDPMVEAVGQVYRYPVADAERAAAMRPGQPCFLLRTDRAKVVGLWAVGEVVGESVVLAQRAGDRLFHMHFNDNHGAWDDDMMVGSIHMVEIFEYFHVLKKNGWEGVWNLDQFPFREDAVENAKLSIRFLKAIAHALDILDEDALAAAQAKQDALGAQKVIQDALLSSMAQR